MFGLERFNPWRAPKEVPQTRPQAPPASESSVREQRESSAQERAAARAALVRDFESRIEPAPESLYKIGRREDAAQDFLLGEAALDLLPRQVTSNVVERDAVSVKNGREFVDTFELPETVQIAGQTLWVEEILGRGGFGVVVGSGPYVLKFVDIGHISATGVVENQHLAMVAREISALARFNPLPKADAEFLEGLHQASALYDPPSTTNRIPGFLGATRVAIPAAEGPKEYIAIAMSRVEGEDLYEAMHEVGTFERVTPDTFPELIKQLAQALQPMHEAGIIHRDIKPSNVMARFPGIGEVDVTLTDMGLMRDEDYWRQAREYTTREEMARAVLAVRERLLTLSLTDDFDERGEELWLRLAALWDKIEAGEEAPASDVIGEAITWLAELPGEVRPAEANQARRALLGAFEVQGTFSYLDSDARRGEPTSASDVFALGLTLRQFLAAAVERRRGKAFSAAQAYALMKDANFLQRTDVVEALGGGARGKRLAKLLGEMTDSEPRNRPQNAGEVLERLEQAMA